MRRLLVYVCLAALAGGCSDAGSLSRRYRAEQLLWGARRAEQSERMGTDRPDSAALLEIRESYARLRKEFPPPYPMAGGRDTTVARQFVRAISEATLSGAGAAMEAKRPDLALEDARFVEAHAAADPAIQKRALLLSLGALQRLGQTAEAESVIVSMMERYRPLPPRRGGEEDAILTLPDALVAFRREAGDPEGIERALLRSETYYRGLLGGPNHPVLEAQVRARLVRVLFERGKGTEAAGEIDRLGELIQKVPVLTPLLPEVLYSQARLRGNRDSDPTEAVNMLLRIATDFPASPFAARSLLDAGATLERRGRLRDALAQYQLTSRRFPYDPVTTPAAIFREAVLQDRLGNWDAAKPTLESILVRFPSSQAAMEAPMAVAEHYVRAREWDAAKSAYAKAIESYGKLILRDTTANTVPLLRLTIFRCHILLNQKKEALSLLDDMIARHHGHYVMVQALTNGARIASEEGEEDRARGYLERFLASFPKSPRAEEVRVALRALKPPA